MEKKELEKWLDVNDSFNVQMPNEIFEDFNKAIFKSYNHKSFAYAYYYLISYLYRNALYGRNHTEQYSQQNIIKLFTGNKTVVSYITKKDGLLDQLRYTHTTNDYPISWYMDNDILEFRLIKELKKEIPDLDYKHSPRLLIKVPVIGLSRFGDEDYTGTFYSYQNTHTLEVNKFIEIITDQQLGHVGLFIYGYLRMMYDKFPNGYQVSNQELGEVVGCSDRTIQNYTQRLETIGFLESHRKVLGNKLLEKVYVVN